MTTFRGLVHGFALRVSVLGFLLVTANANAVTLTDRLPYYGNDFYDQIARGARDQALVKLLHTKIENQHSVGYSTARKYMMGQIYLSGSPGHYIVKDVYCEKEYSNRDFGGADAIGPMKIPKETQLNTEHTWPQSRFTRGYPKDVQKSDLHHLYPTNSQMNAIRGNKKFGEVAVPDRALPCPIAKYGSIASHSDDYFEPPMGHKGNVARSLFYFSVRYNIAIDREEEAFLRKWNHEDPPDAFERTKNDAIEKIQGNRNPFVDYPELVDEITDF